MVQKNIKTELEKIKERKKKKKKNNLTESIDKQQYNSLKKLIIGGTPKFKKTKKIKIQENNLEQLSKDLLKSKDKLKTCS